jgi:hypothetical protein
VIRRRIVFVLPHLALGGAQVVAARLSAILQSRGDSVVFTTLGPERT